MILMMALLTLSAIIQAKGLELSMESIAEVTFGVLKHRHSSCIYLLQEDNSIWDTITYVKLLRELRFLQISVTSISSQLIKDSIAFCQNAPFYVLLHPQNTTTQYLKQIPRHLFSGSRWLIFLPAEDISIDTFFVDVHIPYDSEITVAQHNPQNGKRLVLTEVYRHHPGACLQKHQVAIWSNEGLNWMNKMLPRRKGNLQGVHLKVAVFPQEEVAAKAKCKDYQDEFCVIYYEIWNALQKRTNMRSEFVSHPDGVKYIVPNASWNGPIALLISGQADVAINEYGMTPERIIVIDYIGETFLGKIKTFVRKRVSATSNRSYMLEPFSTGLWWTIWSSLMILIMVLTLSWTASVRLGYSQNLEDYSIYSSWIVVFGIFCQQGQEITPKNWSCRLVILTAYVTYYVTFLAYSAVFISFLAVQHYSLPFNNFKGLLDTGTYRLGVIGTAIYLNIFENASDPVLRKLYANFLGPNLNSLPRTDVEGMNRVCEERNYAFTVVDYSIYRTRLQCEVIEIPRAGFSIPASFLISKNNPYKRVLTHHVEELRRTGILKRNQNILIDKTQNFDFKRTEATFDEVLPIIYILLVGYVVSILCLCTEVIILKISKPTPNIIHFYN
ncbi:Ionotropic receptor 173 [Blattella germanica]|nr:Ionotropic receptor 173 [Blattella germanica]